MGIDVHLSPPKGFVRTTKMTMAFERDDAFVRLVDEGLTRSGGAPLDPASESHVRLRHKLYNLTQLVEWSRGGQGLLAECGTYRGLTAYLLCRVVSGEQSGFRGEGVHIFDSFEGLSVLHAEDRVDHQVVPVGKVKRGAGMFAASVDIVRATLSEFPEVRIHPGWIPASLADAPEGPYRFVHLDLDLHEPTRDALEFFYPKLAAGGLVVFDDYGSIRWPGVRLAVDEFCVTKGIRPLRLSSGHAVLFASPVPPEPPGPPGTPEPKGPAARVARLARALDEVNDPDAMT